VISVRNECEAIRRFEKRSVKALLMLLQLSLVRFYLLTHETPCRPTAEALLLGDHAEQP
jgi:hypothetical protein